jgi:Zn-dependent M28 family amino/carboxypeptidase
LRSARDALAQSLTPENIAGEIAYFQHVDRASFERPYGLAWLLQLSAELRQWNDPQAREWSMALQGLEREAASRLKSWLPKLHYPIRVGEHDQTAFSFGLMWDWAGVAGDAQMRQLLTDAANRFYLNDRNCPLNYEPSGEDFLSPCLAEADFMRRVLDADAFSRWLSGFLPVIPRSAGTAAGGRWLDPAVVTDRADPKLAHLDGLNLSRAWMLEGIAQGLGPQDPRVAVLLQTARRHRDAALPFITGEHYEGAHWLGTFAVYLTSEAGLGPQSRSASPIDPVQLSATVKVLASDAFQGRAPGSPGEAKTVDYLVDRFKSLGLQPAGDAGGWVQKVPLVHNVAGNPTRLEIQVGGSTLPVLVGRDISPQTARETSRVTITGAPMEFVGYGVAAPERGWDDFKGIDLHGKVAIFLVNDPDFEAGADEPVAGRFGGRAMTYYGRWTYKFEEAARRGAIGAFVVHETAAAGYGWNVASNGVGGTYGIAPSPGRPQPVLLQSWISREFAVDLFSKAGLDFDALKRRAREAGFRPVELAGARFSIDMPVKTDRVNSRNVLARLPGTSHPDESILFAAHWDAYGIGAPDSAGRTIRPGANDDGLGIAGVLELARGFARAPRTERTLVFAAWTAEERGLLGSETFGVHPLFPPGKMVADMTLDILQTAGPARDVVLVGAGQNDLEQDLARAAAAQGRTVTPDAKPERGLFYRADHFSLAKRGVPTLLLMAIGGGADLVDGGRAAGDAWVSDYTARCYHQTCDTWNADWDLRGAAEDIDLFYRIGQALGNSRRWPEWNAGSEFKAIRDASASARR